MNGTPIPLKVQPADSVDSFEPVAVSFSPVSQSPLAARFKSDTLGPDLVRQAKVLHPTATDGLKLLLLENISQNAVNTFKDQGFQVDFHTKAWSEDELVEKIPSYHAIGIRSKTRITERVLKSATKVCQHMLPCETVFHYPSASRYWLLLHRHQPSRPFNRSQSWDSCLQFPLFKFTFGCRTCCVRDNCPFPSTGRSCTGNEGRHME